MNFRPSSVRATGAFVASRYGLHRPQQARAGCRDRVHPTKEATVATTSGFEAIKRSVRRQLPKLAGGMRSLWSSWLSGPPIMRLFLPATVRGGRLGDDL